MIVINRAINRLYLYDGAKLRRTFAVATGQAIYPTPRGTFHIVVKYKQPVVVPADLELVGAGAEAGAARAVEPARHALDGLSAARRRHPRHDDAASIGYSASHGCVRMQVPDAEWLFDHVDIGTTVFIV